MDVPGNSDDMTAPAILAADAAGETGYRQRASNPKRPVSR